MQIRLSGGQRIRLLRRASWSVVDQGLSAASNMLLSVIVARTLDAAGFGAFAIAFLTFGFMIAIVRATIGQPLQINYSGTTPDAFATAVRSALGAAIVVGMAAGVPLVIVGLVLSGETGRALVALGVCLPGLLAQDTCRMAFFSSGRADRAALNDGLWTVLEFAALAVLIVSGVHEVSVFILAWGGSAGVAAVVATMVLGLSPRLRGSIRWLVAQRGLTGYLLAEHILGEGLAQVGILLVGVIGSATDVGSLRAAQVLLGPLNIILTAASLFGIPEIARRRETMNRKQRELFCWGMSGAMGVITIGYGATALLLPDSIGVQLLGDTWVGAQTVLLAMCVLAFAVALGAGPGIVLYGLGQARITFGLNLVKGPVLLILLPLGIWQGGAIGAAWALAATEIIVLPFLIFQARRVMRRHESFMSETPTRLGNDL